MILSIRSWLSRLMFIAMFAALTVVFYEACRLAESWVVPVDRYSVPRGPALKVFEHHEAPPEGGTIAERLRWFYFNGE
jgi:hypothetical protein